MTPPGESGASGPRVLLIEDDADIVTLLDDVLTHEGFEVSVAGDGLTGLLQLQSGQPDLALLDIMMPDVDGVRVLEQLLEEGGGRLPVPIIVITGSPDGAARSRELLGSANVFEKPFTPQALLTRMRARLQEG